MKKTSRLRIIPGLNVIKTIIRYGKIEFLQNWFSNQIDFSIKIKKFETKDHLEMGVCANQSIEKLYTPVILSKIRVNEVEH